MAKTTHVDIIKKIRAALPSGFRWTKQVAGPKTKNHVEDFWMGCSEQDFPDMLWAVHFWRELSNYEDAEASIHMVAVVAYPDDKYELIFNGDPDSDKGFDLVSTIKAIKAGNAHRSAW